MSHLNTWNKMSENKNVLIKILEINEISFNHKPLPIPIEEIEFGKNLIYGLGMQFGFDFEKERFNFRLFINYSIPENKNEVLALETEIIFHIKNMKDVIHFDEKNKKTTIKDDLLSTLLGVMIGTSRGILSTKTKGTALAPFPLPIINVKEFLHNMKKTNQ